MLSTIHDTWLLSRIGRDHRELGDATSGTSPAKRRAVTGSRIRTCVESDHEPDASPLGHPSAYVLTRWISPGSNRAPSPCESDTLPNELEIQYLIFKTPTGGHHVRSSITNQPTRGRCDLGGREAAVHG
jgi:hypothetical protein